MKNASDLSLWQSKYVLGAVKVAHCSSDLIFPCSTLARQMTMPLIKYDILE